MDIHDLVQENDQVATLPDIFFRLREVMDDPKSSFDEIAEIIGYDAGLTARLLKIVNSAYFGFSNRIATISHAISIIGMDQLNDLVISTIVINKFKGISDETINMRSFWEHSLACGLAARALAVHKKESNPERFFVAGLLHDIGRLTLCIKCPEKVQEAFQLSKAEDLALPLAERRVMGFDHAMLGGLLLRAWQLPKSHEEAVAFHHQPSRAPEYRFEAAMVHVADIIANTLQIGCGVETSIPCLENEARELTEIGENIFFSSVMKEVVLQFEEASGVFLESIPQ